MARTSSLSTKGSQLFPGNRSTKLWWPLRTCTRWENVQSSTILSQSSKFVWIAVGRNKKDHSSTVWERRFSRRWTSRWPSPKLWCRRTLSSCSATVLTRISILCTPSFSCSQPSPLPVFPFTIHMQTMTPKPCYWWTSRSSSSWRNNLRWATWEVPIQPARPSSSTSILCNSTARMAKTQG